MADLLVEPTRERERRARILRSGTIRVDGVTRKAIIRDVSADGALVQSDIELREGDSVELRIKDAQAMLCEVRWVRDNRAGVQFVRKIGVGTGVDALAASHSERQAQSFTMWRD
ncbi:hypothetical protein B5C34_14105 [Pacificimonas flava]|uniref:PilZ domain-containing protein n=2 Tax=Pacificimonas TaxID=1960290 RepID=A0A219B7Z6_9SPHN|nr:MULTISPECIES: PilZ domain-containing protein [Pacificimonas]MBZ6379956.1 PilZ domain-containing protein [Pacificimonas aurantium]OWV34477.1 hypothetical protein B5C34_14105 [Pacificimonas flava]